MAWINKILYKVNETAQNVIYNLGTTFDNVRVSEENIYSLKNLTDSLANFFEKQSFMHYSKITPPLSSRYVEWYCLEAESDSDFDNEINWDPNESLV